MRAFLFILAATVAALQCGLAAAQSDAAPPPLFSTLSMGPVAMVGHGRVGADMVFELWTPIWHETLARVRNGKMSPTEGDARLHHEWERAVLALIKDELFFQEAEREHNSFINTIVEKFLRAGDPRPREQVLNEIRRAWQQDMDKNFRDLNSQLVKESGGMIKLNKVLEGRGLTFMEWQNRLKKKAFTQSYLHQILKPRAPDPGPRQVQQYYSQHPEEFALPGLVRFRHIFFSNALRGEEQAREDAIDVWERLVDGELDFEAAVGQFSDDSDSKRRGGMESGEEAADPEREAWLADIRTALREEPPGEVAPILESPFGCHIALPIAIGPDRKVPFNEVRRDIERKLSGKVWEEETDRYFHAVRKSTEIKVLMPTYPEYLSCAAQIGQGHRGPRIYNTSRPGVSSRRQTGTPQ